MKKQLGQSWNDDRPHDQNTEAPAAFPRHPTRISFVLADAHGKIHIFSIPSLAAGAIQAQRVPEANEVLTTPGHHTVLGQSQEIV